tara:strand:+ start:25 stop:744 length:720 start_codon:yes stop_codon:yes gene_type:complete
MRQYIFEKRYPSLSYIAKNWPRTKNLLKKFVLSNQKKPDFYKICINCLKDLNVFKLKDYNLILKKLSKLSSNNFTYNSYHDQHHFKSVILISCLLAKLSKLKNSEDKILLVIIALTHDLNHQGRRIINLPYYQEDKSFKDLNYIIYKKITNKRYNRIKRIFKSTFFPVKPLSVKDDLEKIILDADVLGSLMFGMSTGIKFAGRLKHEIRFDNKTDILFRGFLKLLDSKSLYLDSSKKSC